LEQGFYGIENWIVWKVGQKYPEIFRCAEEGWNRSVSWIVWKMKKYYTESRGKLKGRRGGRLKQLLDDLKEGRRYWTEGRPTRSHSVENWLSRIL